MTTKITTNPVTFREGTRKKGGVNPDPDPNYTPPKPQSFKAPASSETAIQAPAWTPVLRLELLRTQSGLLSLGAESPDNLHVVGRSLEEVFASLLQFIKDCNALGQPFAVLEGVKLNAQPLPKVQRATGSAAGLLSRGARD